MTRRSTLISSTLEPVLLDEPPAPVPRLWPAMTPSAQRHLVQQVARLLRLTLTAADALGLKEGDHAERAVDLRRSDHDGASSEAGVHLCAAVHRRASPPAPREHRTAIPAGRSSGLVRLAQGADLRPPGAGSGGASQHGRERHKPHYGGTLEIGTVYLTISALSWDPYDWNWNLNHDTGEFYEPHCSDRRRISFG
jgi:hypothetical protein